MSSLDEATILFYDYYMQMTTIGKSIAFQAEALIIVCDLCLLIAEQYLLDYCSTLRPGI